MKSLRLLLFSLCALCGLVMTLAGIPSDSRAKAEGSSSFVYLLDIDGTVNPALGDYIIKGIDHAVEAGAGCVIIRMDTPGGAVVSTKTIIKHMLNARIPVVVYVAPSGSSATSAGALIVMAADIAAMAPGTNIGAAHPVGGGGQEIEPTMSEKVVNDLTSYIRGVVDKKGRNSEWAEKAIRESVSVSAPEALRLQVIDLMADSVPDLLNRLDGKVLTKDSGTYTLKTAGARVERILPGMRFKILDVVANPNVAYILMMIGGLGILMELYHPGMIFPGVLGAMCLLLSFFALQVLPVNYVGILLILLSIVLFVLELKVLSYGMLTIAAITCLTLGSIMLYDSDDTTMRISWSVIVPMVLTISAFFVFVVGLVFRAHLKKPRTGEEGLIGAIGVAISDLFPEGKVSVHGEYWNARAEGRIERGEKVQVVGIDRLCLLVTGHRNGWTREP